MRVLDVTTTYGQKLSSSCPRKRFTMIGSMACQKCYYFYKYDKVNKTIHCKAKTKEQLIKQNKNINLRRKDTK